MRWTHDLWRVGFQGPARNASYLGLTVFKVNTDEPGMPFLIVKERPWVIIQSYGCNLVSIDSYAMGFFNGYAVIPKN